MQFRSLFALILLTATTAFGAGPESVLGVWKTEMDESKVEIFRCDGKLCGKVVWLKNPNYTRSKDGPVGTPIVDRKNPNPALRGRPIIGLRILEGLTQLNDNTWGNGTCYDPKSGKTYRGKIRLASPNRLELRGYVGTPMFGRTSVWTR